MNDLVVDSRKIENLIYEIRGHKVMLDRDLARLYGCANGTKTINLAVKRHLERFPERFCFKLTKEENDNLRFQPETANMNRSLPYAFTEQGVAMLATVLKTRAAEKVSIAIMDAFVAMRHFIIDNKELYLQISKINNHISYIDEKLLEHDNKFDQLFSMFEKDYFKEKIFFEGEIYDAYSKLIDILSIAKKSIVIIDNYADKTILDVIKNLNVKVCIVTRKKGFLKELDIEKYRKQYDNLTVYYDNSFHDRFILIDGVSLYHLGASFKDLGKKCFAITEISSLDITKTIKEKFERIKDS